jgi:hypothetical protein
MDAGSPTAAGERVYRLPVVLAEISPLAMHARPHRAECRPACSNTFGNTPGRRLG